MNLLIATTVAEEGLDIAECSYVIHLDMPGNEIYTAQARGRVRAQQGKYDVVAGENSGLVEKENTNLLKGILMMRAVDVVKKMNHGKFLEMVGRNNKSCMDTLKSLKTLRRQLLDMRGCFY